MAGIATRVDRDGPSHAWYPLGADPESDPVLVWVAQADGAWAVYHGEVRGPLGQEQAAAETQIGAVTMAEGWLAAALWIPTPPWPL